MEKSSNVCRGNARVLLRSIVLGLTVLACRASIEGKHRQATPMHKVELTQKGYIQFLRWELPVPEITEFTFCLWIESNDLTHPHSIFSYSKDERERLVRSWIGPHGRSVHLEIGGRQVLAADANILENRWYHLCASWENQAGRYGLWVNGQLWAEGYSDETVGRKIRSGGDVVLGQEYTDFDKGLEDGIEGSVLGFNLLLASAFDPLEEYETSYSSGPVGRSFAFAFASSYSTVAPFARIQGKVTQRGIDYGQRTRTRTRTRTRAKSLYAYLPRTDRLRERRYAANAVPLPLSSVNAGLKLISWQASGSRLNDATRESSKRQTQPLGLQLIKLSYVYCEIGRGSPFVGGSLMLISWTRTPVRIFGGATVKNANGKCGDF